MPARGGGGHGLHRHVASAAPTSTFPCQQTGARSMTDDATEPTSGQDQDPGQVQDRGAARHSRRRILTTGAIAGAAALAGAAGGAAAAHGDSAGAADPTPPVIVRPAGRRRFQDKVVIVTGATSGIGRSAAIMFAAEG